MGRILTITYAWARRCAIAVIGGTVVLIGICMIVLPGPAIVVIPAGLAILGLEFACARRWLRRLREVGFDIVGRRFSWFGLRRGSSAPVAMKNDENSSRLDRRVLVPIVRPNGQSRTRYY